MWNMISRMARNQPSPPSERLGRASSVNLTLLAWSGAQFRADTVVLFWGQGRCGVHKLRNVRDVLL